MKYFIKQTLIRLFYLIGQTKIAQIATKKYQGPAIILLLHRIFPDERVSQDKSPNAGLAISCSLFEKQLLWLCLR